MLNTLHVFTHLVFMTTLYEVDAANTSISIFYLKKIQAS